MITVHTFSPVVTGAVGVQFGEGYDTQQMSSEVENGTFPSLANYGCSPYGIHGASGDPRAQPKRT